jgi:hypothetical protein
MISFFAAKKNFDQRLLLTAVASGKNGSADILLVESQSFAQSTIVYFFRLFDNEKYIFDRHQQGRDEDNSTNGKGRKTVPFKVPAAGAARLSYFVHDQAARKGRDKAHDKGHGGKIEQNHSKDEKGSHRGGTGKENHGR